MAELVASRSGPEGAAAVAGHGRWRTGSGGGTGGGARVAASNLRGGGGRTGGNAPAAGVRGAGGTVRWLAGGAVRRPTGGAVRRCGVCVSVCLCVRPMGGYAQAKDSYTFLVNWFNRFPQYKSHDFYISGESYAGHYVPQLAEVVYEHNKHLEANQQIHLKGFIVGNAETDDYYDYTGIVEFAWSHSVISDQFYERVKNVCDFKLSPTSTECGHVMDLLYHTYNEIDIYNVYAPKCNTDGSALSSSSSSSDSSAVEKEAKNKSKRRLRMYSGYDPCYSNYIEAYFNRMDVQKSLNANTSGRIKDRTWSLCSDPIFDFYDMEVFSVLPIYSKLIKAGLRIWVYSGDVDGRVPVIGSRYWVDALGLPMKSQWQPWYLKNQVAGRYVEYEGLTMATVRGAGHTVPQDKPAEALVLIKSFLSDTQLPAKNN
ncbi:serine carboxypeptidase-like 26 [Miscanthus floridulus]|uniref:serine carboxypeptidase-like 26 n=1 Tax=Miscanthus floridulus TaxID=154761 RepID=UPI00345998EB